MSTTEQQNAPVDQVTVFSPLRVRDAARFGRITERFMANCPRKLCGHDAFRAVSLRRYRAVGELQPHIVRQPELPSDDVAPLMGCRASLGIEISVGALEKQSAPRA